MAGRPSQQSIVDKADIAVSNLVSDGGYLNVEQANRFILKIQKQPTMLNQVRRVTMSAPKRDVDKIGFASRILQPAPTSGQALLASQRSAPTTSKITLETKEMIAEVNIPYDVLEDNIERGGLEGTIMGMIAERVALDLEELLITGDTTSSDAFLAQLNGVVKQCSSHLVDASTLTSSDMSKLLLKEAIKAMPVQYLRNRAAMRYFVSHANETDYRDTLADRETGLGDTLIEGIRPVSAYGVPVVPAALMPETYILLTHPLNLIWGIQRDIMMETDKDIRKRVVIIVVTLRCDFKFEEEDACVLVTNVGS